MKKYKYDNKRRVALSTKTWKRLKQFKKEYGMSSADRLINELLDEIEENQFYLNEEREDDNEEL